ncbi:MAG: hypothetical protein DIU78_004010 [Pseudomonadota bacterium]
MRRPARWFSAAAIALLVACNALLGNEEGVLVPHGSGGAGGGTGGASGALPHAGDAGASSTGDGGESGGAGESSTGGAGGDSSTGGGAQGGSANGGTANGGTDAQAGTDSGGSPSGGSAGTGGGSTGGASTGGSGGDGATGGTATGGNATGGVPDLSRERMELWFMADQGVETTLVEGEERVSRWLDQSGREQHAVQSNAELQPRRVTMPSGLPMIEFDGSDSETEKDALRLPEGFASFEGASFFVVAEAEVNEMCAGILSLSNGDDGDDIEFGRHTPNLLYYEVLHEPVEGTENAFEAKRRLLGTIVQSSTGLVELRLNGAITGKPTTISLPANVVRRQNFVGKNTYDECPTGFHGRIGELILYSRGVSTAERERIEAYLADKWDIFP